MLAGSISYFSMMALVPFCLFLITVFGYFLGHYPGLYEFLAERLTSFFPSITSGITNELGKLINFRVIGTFSLVLYGVLSIQVFASLENALNIIFKVKKKRNFFLSIVFSLLIITFIILMLFISFMATTLIPLAEDIQRCIPGSEDRPDYRHAHTICSAVPYSIFYGHDDVCLFPESKGQGIPRLCRRLVYHYLSRNCKAFVYLVCGDGHEVWDHLRTSVGVCGLPALGILFFLHFFGRRGDGAQPFTGEEISQTGV